MFSSADGLVTTYHMVTPRQTSVAPAIALLLSCDGEDARTGSADDGRGDTTDANLRIVAGGLFDLPLLNAVIRGLLDDRLPRPVLKEFDFDASCDSAAVSLDNLARPYAQSLSTVGRDQ